MGERPVQAVFRIQFKQPPPPPPVDVDEEDRAAATAAAAEKHRRVLAASRVVWVAVCLPQGYAMLEAAGHAAATPAPAAASASASPSPLPSLRFASPLSLRESLHALLMHVSPVYQAWKEDEMNRKLSATRNNSSSSIATRTMTIDVS
jgi:hypothetical protein